MKILFVCTSNKDRSPALAQYFSEKYPAMEFKSAGINKYFTEHHNTHLVNSADVLWADYLVAAEMVHATYLITRFKSELEGKRISVVVLDLGQFNESEKLVYLKQADEALTKFIFNSPIKNSK